MNQKTVLILGATGRFGQAAVTAFAAAGWQVLAQSRRATTEPLPPGVRQLLTPIKDTQTLRQQASGASIIIYAVNTPYPKWHKEALSNACLGMDLAQKLNATFMLPGNVYNFGAEMPALLKPDTPENASTRKGKIRCAIEAEMAARANRGLRSVVIRAGDFFGGGPGVWMDLVILKSIKSGKLVYPGPLNVPHAWAYLPDVAQAFLAVAEKDVEHGFERLHFSGYALSGKELLDTIETAALELGICPKAGFRRNGLPWSVIRLGGLVLPQWRELAEMAYLWDVPHTLDGSALQQKVGALTATPCRVALRQSLVELGWGDQQKQD